MTGHDQDDYLWDRSGTDPDVERLEGLLAPFAHDPTARPLPAPPAVPEPANRPWPAVLLAALIVAAAVVIGVVVVWPWPEAPLAPSPGPLAAGWAVEVIDGMPRCGDQPQIADFTLRPGDWLETDVAARARVQVADIGEMEVAPHSRLKLVKSTPSEHRLQLAVGRIDAFVVAPPRVLVVETPSAVAVDMGCAYTLEVGADGSTSLAVTSGWVALETEARTSFVPAGARALARVGHGPGTPWFADADPALSAGLLAIDLDTATARDVDALLAVARPRDTLSLVHVLERVPEDERGRVLDRIEALAPTAVDRSAALSLDSEALLGLLDDVSGVW